MEKSEENDSEKSDSEQQEEYIEIPLKNKDAKIVAYTKVDRDIYDSLSSTPVLNKDGYCQMKINGITILLHRFVMDANKGDPKVDHINGDKLDNRRANLRFATNAQNSQNKAKKDGTSSQYIGVYKRVYDYGIRWIAKIRINGKRIEKTFKDEEQAAYWYNSKALEFHESDDFNPSINKIEKPNDYEVIPDKNASFGTNKRPNGNFEVTVQNEKKGIHVGTFKTQEEAKEAYIKKKEELNKINLQKKVGTKIQRNEEGIAVMITTKGEEILVDDENYFALKRYTWILNTKGYAQTNMIGMTVTMHRYLMDAPTDIMVDHINHNKLDNRMSNLRLVNDVINSHNVTKRSNTSSKYIGVYKRGEKYAAEIKKEDEHYYLGVFKTELEAAKARDKKAIELYGSDANLNLPREELNEEVTKTTKTSGNHNKTKVENTTSKYIGVCKKGNKFSAEIKKDKVKYRLGTFATEIEAAQARDKKALELYGSDANLNFPLVSEDDEI